MSSLIFQLTVTHVKTWLIVFEVVFLLDFDLLDLVQTEPQGFSPISAIFI